MHVPCVFLAVLLAASAQAAENDDPANDGRIEELVVYGRAQTLIGASSSASEGVVGYDDIQLPPMLRVGELVEAVPGMVATQHSGTGKANQYFIRGFNLDHGTDFSVALDGVPINMRTHGHGQGYLDLNFMIPELVETTRYRRGPYAAVSGDFSTAASVDFQLYERMPETVIAASAGQDAYLRAMAAGSTDAGSGVLTGAVDITRYDGPWALEENLVQNKFYGAYSVDLGNVRATLGVQSYDGEWDSTDQIPARAVRPGGIGELGYIDPDLGGKTGRHALTGTADFGTWRANAYVIDYDLTLYSNFTYLLDDPLNGDEFEQRDSRRIYGAGVRGARDGVAGMQNVELRWGGNVRYDDIDTVGLYATAARQRLDTVREDAVRESSLGAFGEAEFRPADRLRAVIGLRADYYDWDVDALRAANSGSGDDSLLSPSIALAYRINDGLEAYLDWGRGFHSNDVRGTTISIDPRSGEPVAAVDALVPSTGTEAGLRFERGERFNATLVLFLLDLDSELVYVGDAGTTEPNDATRRRGIEATLFWQANRWLAVNSAYTATHAEFENDQGGGKRIPGAVESTFTFGLNAAWDNGLKASARVRWLDAAPLVEDNSVRSGSSLLVNAGVAWQSGRTEYRLDLFNVLDSDDDDIAYFYASRLAGEPAGGIEDLHFHPLEPRTIRASVAWHWN